MKNINRRNFVKNASAGTIGAATLGFVSPAGANAAVSTTEKRREVWIAAMTNSYSHGKPFKEAHAAMLQQMENAVPFKPDIYCLPETFADPAQKNLDAHGEDGSGRIAGPYQAFAKKHSC